jgi:hypothetical protein
MVAFHAVAFATAVAVGPPRPAGDAHLFVSVKQVADGHPDPDLKLEGNLVWVAWASRRTGRVHL